VPGWQMQYTIQDWVSLLVCGLHPLPHPHSMPTGNWPVSPQHVHISAIGPCAPILSGFLGCPLGAWELCACGVVAEAFDLRTKSRANWDIHWQFVQPLHHGHILNNSCEKTGACRSMVRCNETRWVEMHEWGKMGMR
jgi:hypothetical protein